MKHLRRWQFFTTGNVLNTYDAIYKSDRSGPVEVIAGNRSEARAKLKKLYPFLKSTVRFDVVEVSPETTDGKR